MLIQYEIILFRPITLSDEVRRAFAENAARIGVTNPLIDASLLFHNFQMK